MRMTRLEETIRLQFRSASLTTMKAGGVHPRNPPFDSIRFNPPLLPLLAVSKNILLSPAYDPSFS